MAINSDGSYTRTRLERAVGRLDARVSALIVLAIATFAVIAAILASQFLG